MIDKDIQRFRDKFIEEVHMLLDNFEKDILELEVDSGNVELRNSVFRAMHTIKGISAMYGFDYISEFSHLLENIFQNIRDSKISFSKDISEVSLQSIDHIRQLIGDEKLVNNELRQAHNILLGRIKLLENAVDITTIASPKPVAVKAPMVKKIRSWYIIVDADEQMYFRGINLVNICNELASLGELKINRIPVLNSSESDSWGFLLVTDALLDEINDAILFIDDNCCVIKVADYDVLNVLNDELIDNEHLGPSILDLIEDKNLTSMNLPIEQKQNDKLVASQTPASQAIRRLSVDKSKLDNLMYLVSQLVTLNTQLNEATQTRDYDKQLDYLEVLDALSKQFRNNALEILLVPLSDIALRFQRLIRDLSKSLNKKIEFITEGIETELDKNTIDGIAEPIMHIIRNSMDHGIEEPEQRKKAGKPETGTIRLSANYSGNFIYITISDDGNGVDLDKISKKAIERGLISSTDNLSENELLDLIFIPGFSTAQNLSEVSGRGVGMDIVRKRISELRGSVTVETKKGVGTSFVIKISQSMAITDTLLFKVENDHFILPIAEIKLCDQFEPEDWEMIKHKSLMPYNNELIPMINLRQVLNIDGEYNDQMKTIIVRCHQQSFAILADAIVGEHQAVLKPLDTNSVSDTFISSVSQLGNGKIAFLIDIVELHKKVLMHSII